MQTKSRIKKNIVITILIGIISVILYAFLLEKGQNGMIMRQFQEEMEFDTKSLRDMYKNGVQRHEFLQKSFDDLYEQDLWFFNLILIDYLTKLCKEEDGINLEIHKEELDSKLLDVFLHYLFTADITITDIMIADTEGNIISSCFGKYKDLKDEIYDPLRETFETRDTVKLRLLTEEDACASQVEESGGAAYLEQIGNNNLYALSLFGDYELVISVDARKTTILQANSDNWTVLLENEVIGEQGYAFVWSEKTKKILYYPDSTFKYKDIKELGMNMDEIRDGEYGWNTIGGENMYVYPVYDKEEEVWIACAVSRAEMIGSRRFIVILQVIIFALLAAALVYYTVLLIKQDKIHVLADFTESGKTDNYQSRQYKLFIIITMTCTCMLLFNFYLQTLYLMSSWAKSAGGQTERIELTVLNNSEQAEQFKTLYGQEKKAQLGLLCYILSEDDTLWSQENLNAFAEILNISNMQILDENGKSKLGTTSLDYFDDDTKEQTDEILDYVQITENQDTGRSVFDWMKDGRKNIQRIEDDNGNSKGYLYTYYYSDMVDLAMKSYSLHGTFNMVRPGKNGNVFAVNRLNNTFTYYPDASLLGENALEHGLTENQIKENYCDFITISNVVYFAITARIDDDIIFYSVRKDNLLSQRLVLALTGVILAFILFQMIGIMLYTSREQIEITPPEIEDRNEKNIESSAEFKFMRLLKYYLAFAATIVSLYSSSSAADNSTVLGYVLDGSWEPGLNVFALTASLIILCKGGIVLFIISRLVNRVRSIFSPRTSTILRMITSLLIYIATAFLLFKCMVCFGLNPTALMASTGIFAVVLGIGANSLVGDIIAGIFLLMEGDVQVGDVVQIGGFRGYVMELGIRMTKIYDMDTADVKIIPNNEVRNVVHMTMRISSVYSEFQIRYEEKIEDVERILVEELKNVKTKSPYILEGPVYIGVSALGDNGVTLKTATKCHEAYRKKVEREVNHIVYTIFQKNNIDVPYPQVTLHTGDDSRVERGEENN